MEKRKKIALCLSGFIGSSGKWISGKEIDYNYGYDYIKFGILDNADVDVFIHSYSTNHKKGILDLYNPKKSVFEENKQFTILGKKRDELPDPYAFSIKSMWYSRKRSVELAIDYERENNIAYDHILLTRFDIAFFKKFEFEKYDSSKLYIAGPIKTIQSNGEEYATKVNDVYFMGNSKTMSEVIDVYNTYENIAKQENPDYPMERVSSHKIMTYHLGEKGLFDNIDCALERPWGSSMKWYGDIRFLRADPNLKYI